MPISKLNSNELVRKVIHLSSSAVPLMYWFMFERDVMLYGIIFMACGFLLAEYLRLHLSSSKSLFIKVFGASLRDHEHHNLTGATYVFTGTVICIFLFPKEIAVPSLLILSISDTFAALVGIPFGKHKFLAKSLEGSSAFFVVTMLILSLFFPENLITNVLVALGLTVAEAFPVNLDDNFMIPLLSGGLLSLVGLF